MSLIRQIWWLLLGSLLLAFVSAVGVTTLSARDTIQTQLQLKNNDNAQSLALALSQQRGQPELMELVLAAQFDTGFYRSIRLVGTDGKTRFARDGASVPQHAPAWFVHALPIESAPGTAQVSDGWRALGALQVVSQTAYAHDELWRGTQRAVLALAAVLLVAVLVARVVVARIRTPLDRAVRQAQSLVNGEFVTVPEPRVGELRRLTQAMNFMVGRLKTIFEAQAAQVESLRQQAHADPLTGLANRAHFMAQLDAQLRRDDAAEHGGIVLLRLLDLAGVNRRLGRVATDALLRDVATALRRHAAACASGHVGRLNGSDFALCVPVGGVALSTAQALMADLRTALGAVGAGIDAAAGALEIRRGQAVGVVMGAADTALAGAEMRGAFNTVLGAAAREGSAQDEPRAAPAMGESAWRAGLAEAIERGRMRLVRFPVIDAQGELVHLECPLHVQLEADGAFEPAARWLPLALRSGLTPRLDEAAIARALADISRDGLPRCINVSTASLQDGVFVVRVRAQLAASLTAARALWLEVPEAAAVDHFAEVQEFARQLRPFGVRVGLEHAGERLNRITRLFEAGLDFVKLDASVTQGAGADEARAEYLKSVAAMLQALAMRAYAEGVVEADDALRLWQVGIDGITGPWASTRRPDLLG